MFHFGFWKSVFAFKISEISFCNLWKQFNFKDCLTFNKKKERYVNEKRIVSDNSAGFADPTTIHSRCPALRFFACCISDSVYRSDVRSIWKGREQNTGEVNLYFKFAKKYVVFVIFENNFILWVVQYWIEIKILKWNKKKNMCRLFRFGWPQPFFRKRCPTTASCCSGTACCVSFLRERPANLEGTGAKLQNPNHPIAQTSSS